MHKVEDRNAARKRSMSQDEWWTLHGHTVSEAKQRNILKKPSATTSGRVGQEGEDAEAPPVPAEEDERKEDDEKKGGRWAKEEGGLRLSGGIGMCAGAGRAL